MKETRKQKTIKEYQEKGITLIALVVTIIVLLILAGVAIGLTVGDNGIFNRAENATKEYSKAEIKEELEMAITGAEMDNAFTGVNKQEIAKVLEEKGVIINNVGDEYILGEYKDYEIQVDENNKVIVGGKLTGAKPTGEAKVTTEGEGLEKVEIEVTAQTTEGEIASIESINGLTAKTTNISGSSGTTTYEVEKNGTYSFIIAGTNKRKIIVSVNVTQMIETIEAESLFAGIKSLTSGGKKKINVSGGAGGKSSDASHYNKSNGGAGYLYKQLGS